LKSREEVTNQLEQSGIETRPIVAGNLARHPAILNFPSLCDAELPGADVVHDRGFYIGIHPVDMSEQINRVSKIFEELFS